jgi:malonyl-CoA O-methyltransferase
VFNVKRLRNDFDSAATRYDTHARLQQHVLLQLAQRLPRLNPSSLILDAGCGTGAFARISHHSNVVALDHAFQMCAQAKKSSDFPVTADMAALPFNDKLFDAVVSSLALQWAPDWKSTLREWRRVLKPNGILAFSTFGAGTLRELHESFASIDKYTHVSGFMSAEDIWQHLPARVEVETITEYYPDVAALSRHLKLLGARNKHSNAKQGLTTPRQLEKVESYYASHFGTAHGLRVSWNVLYVTLQNL